MTRWSGAHVEVFGGGTVRPSCDRGLVAEKRGKKSHDSWLWSSCPPSLGRRCFLWNFSVLDEVRRCWNRREKVAGGATQMNLGFSALGNRRMGHDASLHADDSCILWVSLTVSRVWGSPLFPDKRNG